MNFLFNEPASISQPNVESGLEMNILFETASKLTSIDEYFIPTILKTWLYVRWNSLGKPFWV